MSTEEMKKVVEEFVNAVMKNDVEKVVSLCTDDIVYTDPAGMLKGHNGMRIWMKWLYSHFAKFTIREISSIADGIKLVSEYIFEGTTPEGLTAKFQSVVIYEFKDLKIQRKREYYDVLGIAKQVAKGWLAKRALKSLETQYKKGLR